ncbi:hypothetical protein Cni_G17892 [Canna indica]|uniref:Avr9/Cf-9 rapidly elicited protein 146 n=1 Tax=Canna indica TaxID=4628 RepID=A0AAQ3KIG0_9LILI|nr:hypothetical protein Cni_G17892 [Canna indica]
MVQLESTRTGKKLWHILRVVFYMLGISKNKIMMDLNLLLKRGKIAGKVLGNLVTFHHHHHHGGAAAMYAALTCRSMDPNRSFYSPREVEFSCSNTPSYPSLHAIKRKARYHHHHHRPRYDYDAAAVAKALEILNSELSDAEEEPSVASPSPAPANYWSNFGKSPAGVRQLRITDSPFPLKEEEEEEEEMEGCIDQEAEEFINKFYEQLRLQQLIPATPEYSRHRPLMGRA